MLNQRYALRHRPNGTWTVIDIFTGWPAEFLGTQAVGLDLEEADDLVDLLNLLDTHRREADGWTLERTQENRIPPFLEADRLFRAQQLDVAGDGQPGESDVIFVAYGHGEGLGNRRSAVRQCNRSFGIRFRGARKFHAGIVSAGGLVVGSKK